MTTMWMVRGDGGRLYEDFRERQLVAVGWAQLGFHVRQGMSRAEVLGKYRSLHPDDAEGRAISGSSQVWRFVNEVAVGDDVVTYSPFNRTYLVGRITGSAIYREDLVELGMALARSVQWTHEIERDALTDSARNSLGSTLTLFQVPPDAAEQVRQIGAGIQPQVPPLAQQPEPELADPFLGVETQSIERIKDRVSRLAWDEMQELVAGILRAMGYKTQVSPAGADRGKDIIASPDGFGFENPRIVVEVKHRTGQMGTQAIRSFLGGRHPDDRGLYVSTGGFSREAYYEADRAAVPLTLWTLDNVVRALVDHYDSTDTETKRLMPLKRLYWPA